MSLYQLTDAGIFTGQQLVHNWQDGVSLRTFLLSVIAHNYEGSYRYPVVDDLGLVCLAMTSLCLKDQTGWQAASAERRGLFFGSRNGCRQTDLAFLGSLDSRPSPRLFVQTLPNIAAGQVANCFEVRGEQLVLLSDQPNHQQLRTAASLFSSEGNLDYCLIGWFDLLGDHVEASIELVPATFLRASTTRFELAQSENAQLDLVEQ